MIPHRHRHLLHLLVLLEKSITFDATVLLKLGMHIDLAILDLDKLPQSITVLLQCLVLLSDLLLLLLLLVDTGLVRFLLLTQICDLPLQL